jgi:N-acetylglutamate synthase-like GNAT family acetyltransferase
MPPDKKTLQHAIATSFFHVYPHIPDVLHLLNFEGLQGYEIPQLSNPWANFLGAARLSPENAAKTVQQVYDYFAADKRSFGWMLDSDAKPDNLAERLQKIGMSISSTYAGMALLDMNPPIKINPAIQIRRARADDISDIMALMQEAFGSGESNSALYEYSLQQDEQFFFMAYVEEREKAVALARMYYYPDSEIVVMQDAVTTADYRGRGIYPTLMAKRLEIARNDGKQVAVMQADRASSAPICARMGFEELSQLDFYVWYASSTTHS